MIEITEEMAKTIRHLLVDYGDRLADKLADFEDSLSNNAQTERTRLHLENQARDARKNIEEIRESILSLGGELPSYWD